MYFQIIAGRTCFNKQRRVGLIFPLRITRILISCGSAFRSREKPGEGRLILTTEKIDSITAYLLIIVKTLQG